MVTRTRMTNADAAWLHMDRPTNRMIINAAMWFDEPVDWDRFTAVFTERLLEPYPRFRQRVVERVLPVGKLHWEEDLTFNLDRHMQHVTLPAPGDDATLHRYVAEQMSLPLAADRPLWQAHLIDGYNGGSAMYIRLHHAVSDGIALVRLLLSITDDTPETVLFEPPAATTLDTDGLADRARDLVGEVVSTSTRIAQEGMGALTNPARAIQLAQIAFDGTRTLSKTLLTPPDHRTVLKGRMGQAKHALWSAAVPLDDIKAIGRDAGATVNDVICAAVTGALRTYLQRRDSLVPDVRAFVPFNLRPLDEPLPRDLGNQFGLVFLSLPVGLEGRRERLVEVKRRMDAIKSSPEGAVAYGILSVTGMTPVQIERVIVDVFGAKGSLVLTNVPGPTEPVYLAGTRLAGFMGWVPATGGIGLGISVFSYAGNVNIGVHSDARLVPDPQVMVDAFQDELAAMLADINGTGDDAMDVEVTAD